MQKTQEMWVQSLSREDPLENEIATHPSIPAWKIPWTKPGRLLSMGSKRVRHHITWAWKGEKALFFLSTYLNSTGKYWNYMWKSSFMLGRSDLGAWAASPALFLPFDCKTWSLLSIKEGRWTAPGRSGRTSFCHQRANVSALWEVNCPPIFRQERKSPWFTLQRIICLEGAEKGPPGILFSFPFDLGDSVGLTGFI